MNKFAKNLVDQLKNVYNRLDKSSGGIFNLIATSVESFTNAKAPQAAAAIAYFALFSLFPLLLLIIAVGSFILERNVVQQQVSQAIAENLPGAQNLIQQNIQRVLALRGTVSIVGIVGLLWAASGVFNTLAYNINAAWTKADVRNFLKRRLVALSIVGVLVALLILSVLSTFVTNLLAQFSVPLGDGIEIYQTGLWRIWSNLLPVLLRLALFWGLYRWVPNAQVSGWAAFWGAVLATTGWELATNGFAFFLSSGLASYELVYGSLGTIVGLMFWIYLGSLITLFGAHLTATITQRNHSTG
ncbi:MAG: YihY/virulence factor BrkB family protein [Anaerolineae bacterium]|nr:YihY/virulence factor BrkB family protein [Anaerolineae bacterium]